MNVKIIGSNCKNGMQLYKMTTRAIESVGGDIKIEKLDDHHAIERYNVKNIPGLVINDKLVSQGKVLSEREISKILQ
ncbi:MAG: thioredoxin family protein [Clostridia bacterium]